MAVLLVDNDDEDDDTSDNCENDDDDEHDAERRGMDTQGQFFGMAQGVSEAPKERTDETDGEHVQGTQSVIGQTVAAK